MVSYTSVLQLFILRLGVTAFPCASSAVHMEVVSFLLSSPQGTPADVLYKGTITRLITEDSASRAERERDEALSKAHVLYEGISGHILTYDREYRNVV